MRKKLLSVLIVMLMISSGFVIVNKATGDPVEHFECIALKSGVFQSQSLTVDANETSVAATMSNPLPIMGVDVANPSIESGGGYDCAVYEYKHDGFYDIGVARKTESGTSWDSGYFNGPDGVESIPDVDYWGSSKKFYATATYSNTDDLYYIEIPDISGDPTSWLAWVVDLDWGAYNFDFYDSNSVACYSGHKVIYALIGTTDHSGGCDHAPMLLYKVDSENWTIRWFPDLGGSSHISIDIDQNTGMIYLAFENNNNLYLLTRDFDDLEQGGEWPGWFIDESYNLQCPDVSAGHGVVYMTAQAFCNDDWDPWYFHSEDDETLYYGWLLGTSANEKYPRVSLTYDGSHVVGNWIYTKNNALYSSPDDMVSGSDSVSSHYRASDVALGHAAWTISSEDVIHTADISVGDYLPHAFIDSISPNPAGEGETVYFNGLGWDPDGWIIGYEWESDLDGVISTQSSFSRDDLSLGVHTISFTVKDNNNHWSLADEEELEIINLPPYTPSNPSPPDGATNRPTSIILQWDGGDPEGDPVTYDVYFGTTNPPPKVVNNQSETYYIPDLDYDTTYYWKIVSWDDHDNYAEGPVWRFTTKPAPYTVFKPLNATGNMDYPYPFTDSYHENHTSILEHEWNDVKAASGANKTSGIIGGYAYAMAVKEWTDEDAECSAWQNVTFYTGQEKNVHVTVELSLLEAEIDIGDASGEIKIGHETEASGIIWDIIVDPYWDWDNFLDILFMFMNYLGFLPGTIIQIMSWICAFTQYYLLYQEFENFYLSGDADYYTLEFDMVTNNGDYNTISAGIMSSVEAEAGWETGGTVNSTFLSQIFNITIDGIAPPGAPIVNGPTTGYTSESYEFSAVGYDPNDDQIQYGWDWNGDGIVDEWTELENSGTTVYISHTWNDPGDYTIKVKSRDIDLMESDVVNYYFSVLNRPPGKPKINGPISGSPGTKYDYTFVSDDPDGNDVFYWIEWGDGQGEDGIGPFNSGEKITVDHTWDTKGTYTIKAIAKDIHDAESEEGFWIVVMPKNTGCVQRTQINMAYGYSPSVKNIEDIEVGDYISSYDLELQVVVSAEVTAVHEYMELPENPLDINYNFENNIKVTSNLFLFINGTEWMEADDVGIDYYILENTPGTNDTSLKPITSINELRKFGVIYDLEIKPLEYGNVSGYFADGILVGYKRQAIMSVCTLKDEYSNNEIINITDPPGDPPPPPDDPLGYELLDNGKVLHIWNKFDSYYFNTSSGIQLTNHYNEYWSHNVLMLGYYNNDEWNLLYRTDELSFNKDIETDNETFVNATLWKDLTYNGYDFRLAIRYHLGIDDNELTVIPYIKNLGDAIPYVLGFAWEINDIQIDMTPENDYIEINDTSFYLNETIDVTYTNLSDARFCIKENMGNNRYKDLYLRWNISRHYLVQIKSREGQYNAPVTLAIRIGTLAENQEKQMNLFWHDASGLETTLYSIKDSYLRKHYPNNNYGSLNYMWIDCKLTQTNRMLVQMDLPPELDDAYIESATLKIYYYAKSGINPQYRKHECWRIEEPWNENGVTWNNQPDLDALEDTITLGGAYGYKSWDVTDNVQDFVNGNLDNYGWLLADETEGTALSRAAKYYSREKSGTIYDPKLVIEYLAPPETQTNEVSNIQESQIRMNGEVIDDGGGDCQYSFSYSGWVNGYPISSATGWTGSVATDESFYTYLYSLDEGRYGSYRARLRHSVYPSVVGFGSSTGFLTKPDTLTGFTATAYEEQINLTWSNNDGGDGAYIEWFTSPDGSWDPGDHTKVDADGYVAGESFIHENRIPGTSYYYKAWAYADDAGWRSSGNSTAPFGDTPKTAEASTGVTTSVDTINPYIQTSSPLTITAAGSPDLDNVMLYWYSIDNSTWIEWKDASNPDTNSPWSWEFDFPEGRGYYEFYSIGTKNHIVESAPSSFDAQCFYENQSKIKNIGSTDIKGYLLMQVHFFDERLEEWVVADDTVNETITRVINAGEQLGLDTIFNGLVNTNDLSEFGSGTYRIYVAFRDIDGNVLICNDSRKMEAWCEFTITFD